MYQTTPEQKERTNPTSKIQPPAQTHPQTAELSVAQSSSNTTPKTTSMTPLAATPVQSFAASYPEVPTHKPVISEPNIVPTTQSKRTKV